MAQVLLVNPTYRGRSSNICMPSGLLCVAAILKARGHEIQILDSHVDQYNPSQAVQAVARMSFDILEIPISYIPRGRAEGKKIYWRDGFASIWTLVKYRFVK